MITIVDYGVGNLGSLQNMLKKIAVPARVSSTPTAIADAGKLLLPGVGAFDSGMSRLRELGLVEVLNERVLKAGVPVLGVCLGMQLLTEGSEEGQLPGLGWIAGTTVRFRFDPQANNLKIPHMGWNTARPTATAKLFGNLPEDARFYFVHSYHVECRDNADVATWTTHGYEFVSAVQHGNIYGAQFHPEKSHKFGMQLLRNFAELT